MRRKLLSFIFSLYLSSSVFCALEKYSRIGINVRTEEHPVFKSLRLHLFPLVQYLYEAAALANDYGDISKHELVRLVLQDAINPTMSKEHTLLSTSFYQRVHPTVAEATSKHSNRVKALKSPYNSMVITRFHEDFSQLVVRYTMAMSFIELTERAMDGFSVVIIQCDNFFRTLVGSRVSLKNFFMEYRRYQSVEVKYFIKNEEMTVSVKDGYYALLFESKFLEYIDYYKAYLSMNDLIKKFPTLFPFKGLVEPLVVPLENFLSIPNCTKNYSLI